MKCYACGKESDTGLVLCNRCLDDDWNKVCEMIKERRRQQEKIIEREVKEMLKERFGPSGGRKEEKQ